MNATKTNQADQRVALRWIPKNSVKIEHELGVCYTEDKLNTPRNIPIFTVMGYIGTARKSAFYESYRTAEQRDKRLTEFFANLESHAVMMAERKAEREKPHSLNVGDVQPEQPIRQILTREVREYGDWEPGIGNRTVSIKTVPIEPEKRKAQGKSVHFKHGCGTLWDGRPKYESWYA